MPSISTFDGTSWPNQSGNVAVSGGQLTLGGDGGWIYSEASSADLDLVTGGVVLEISSIPSGSEPSWGVNLITSDWNSIAIYKQGIELSFSAGADYYPLTYDPAYTQYAMYRDDSNSTAVLLARTGDNASWQTLATADVTGVNFSVVRVAVFLTEAEVASGALVVPRILGFAGTEPTFGGGGGGEDPEDPGDPGDPEVGIPSPGGGPAGSTLRKNVILADDPFAYFPMYGDDSDTVIGELVANNDFTASRQVFEDNNNRYFGGADGQIFYRTIGSAPVNPIGDEATTGRVWHDLLDRTDQVTLEAWIRPGGDGPEGVKVIASMFQEYYGFALRVYTWPKATSTDAYISFVMGYGSHTACEVHRANFINSEHHVVGTYDGSNLRLYIDGTLAQTTAFAGGLAPNDYYDPNTSYNIGGHRDHTNEDQIHLYDGWISDVAFYSYALSGTQIAAHASPTTLPDTTAKWPPMAAQTALASYAWITRLRNLDDNNDVNHPSQFDINEVTWDVVVNTPPTTGDKLIFWAFQVDFMGTLGDKLGGMHAGFQWHPHATNDRAVNFGGYDDVNQTTYGGTTSSRPMVGGSPNTVDYNWVTGQTYRFRLWIPEEHRVALSVNGELIRELYVDNVGTFSALGWFTEDFRSYDAEPTTVVQKNCRAFTADAKELWADEIYVDHANHTYRHKYRDVSGVAHGARFRYPGTRTTPSETYVLLSATPPTDEEPVEQGNSIRTVPSASSFLPIAS